MLDLRLSRVNYSHFPALNSQYAVLRVLAEPSMNTSIIPCDMAVLSKYLMYFVKTMRKIFTFLREAKAELQKVTWPSKNQVTRSTLLVVLLTLLMAVFLGSLDYGFGIMLKQFI